MKSHLRQCGAITAKINGERIPALMPRLLDAKSRLSDMDAMGVQVQVLTPSPSQYYYWADEELAGRIIGTINDEIAAFCAACPERFVGMASVAIQHPARAAEQLRLAMRDRKLRGAMVSTFINDIDLADPFFAPFWQAAEEMSAIIFVHPWSTGFGSRLADHNLMNTIGLPIETTICLSKLIFSGALDRYPNVKILVSHGGGYLPHCMGRSDHAHLVRPEAGYCQRRPSEYLKRIWYDSIVYGSDQLRRLALVSGTDRLVFGSDYPFDMGHYDPATLLASFDDQARRAILWRNAATLFGIEGLVTVNCRSGR
jgi:aminocarboxymuconate-semialdehyde decarboxylase